MSRKSEGAKRKMDSFTRGRIERHLDDILTEEVLRSALRMFRKDLAPTVVNFEDSLFGYIIGRIIQFAFDIIMYENKRPPASEEYVEIWKIVERRALEIKSKIRTISNI